MRELLVIRDVEASAEDVWHVITNLDTFDNTISAIERVERLDDGEAFGVGTEWRETRTMFGRTATEEMRVTNMVPGRSYVTVADSHGAVYRSEMAVEPTGGDACKVSMTFGAETHGVIARVLSATLGRLFERATRKACAADLADIAAVAEGNSRRDDTG